MPSTASTWTSTTSRPPFGPPPTPSPVTGWLESAGITAYKVDGAFVDFATDLTTANSLLNATYQQYTAASSGVTKLRTLSYSIPDEVEDYVALVDPSTYFSSSTKAFAPYEYAGRTTARSAPGQQPRQASSSCETSITPACLKEMYNVGNYTPDVSLRQQGRLRQLHEPVCPLFRLG